MRSLLLTLLVLAAALPLEGCRERRSPPVPGPQSQSQRRAHGAADDLAASCPYRRLLRL